MGERNRHRIRKSLEQKYGENAHKFRVLEELVDFQDKKSKRLARRKGQYWAGDISERVPP